jgi:hypothetical protein
MLADPVERSKEVVNAGQEARRDIKPASYQLAMPISSSVVPTTAAVGRLAHYQHIRVAGEALPGTGSSPRAPAGTAQAVPPSSSSGPGPTRQHPRDLKLDGSDRWLGHGDRSLASARSGLQPAGGAGRPLGCVSTRRPSGRLPFPSTAAPGWGALVEVGSTDSARWHPWPQPRPPHRPVPQG